MHIFLYSSILGVNTRFWYGDFVNYIYLFIITTGSLFSLVSNLYSCICRDTRVGQQRIHFRYEYVHRSQSDAVDSGRVQGRGLVAYLFW